ncbi:MAG: hypothetical protein ACE5KM_06595 [Planctomycetaceae bacterium]
MRRLIRPSTVAALMAAGSLGTVATAAAPAPETLLAKESVAYFRFDGVKRHREAFDKTAFAQLLNEDFGPLIDAVAKMIYDAMGPSTVSGKLLQGKPPKDLMALQRASRQLPRFVSLIRDRGFAVGVEVIAPSESRFQVTVVCNRGGTKENFPAVLGALRVLASLNQGTVKQQTIGTRTVFHWSDGVTPVSLHCWREGPHAVLTIGTESPSRTIELAEGKRGNLTTVDLYRGLTSFRRYKTWMRGFVDVSASLELVKKAVPPAGKIIAALGVDGLKQVSFQAGFEGRLLRSTLAISMPAERRGVLKLLAGGGDFSVDKLPPLPPDAVSVAAGSADYRAIVDEGMRALRLLSVAIGDEDFTEFVTAVEKTVQNKTADDLIGSLGSTFAIYNAPTEGAFSLGTTVVVQVKDAAKLQRALDRLPRAVSIATGADISVKKRQYRGATLNMIQLGIDEFPLTPTYVVHDGRLAVSLFPQPVMGLVYRSEKGRGKWKPPALLGRALRESLKRQRDGGKPPRLTGISVSDPRYSARQLLAFAPLISIYARALGGTSTSFDNSLIPNAQAVSDRLSENVTVSVDDGNGLRIESYSTVPLPFQFTGLELYGLMAVVPFVF